MFKIKTSLFFLLMLVLLAPMLLHWFGLQFGASLRGWQAPPKKITLTGENWMDGTWQENQEGQIKSRFKSRHFLIRLNNQLKYSLFGHINAKDVIQGKKEYLFEERYIQAYLGLNVQGEKSIAENVNKLQAISDSLHANGTGFLMVLASGKGTFMPEHFPAPYDQMVKQRNNYEAYRDQLAASSIPYLDLNQYLLDMKDTTSYPLYTKGNTHWSAYALNFVLDTLVKKVEYVLQKDLPEYTFGPVTIETKARDNDAGIFDSFNLLWSSLEENYAYAELAFQEDSSKFKPRVWTVGDSFYGTLFEQNIPHQLFEKNSRFLYYYKEAWTHSGEKFRTKDIQNLKAWVNDLDLVMVFITDANIGDCCWGMTGTFYDLFH